MAQTHQNPSDSAIAALTAGGELRVDGRTFMQALGASATIFYRLRKSDPDFPKPVMQLHRNTRWRLGDVHAYLAKLNQRAKQETQQ